MIDTVFFTPRVPTPFKKPYLKWGFRDNLRTIIGMAINPMDTLSDYQFQLPIFQYSIFGSHFSVINDPKLIRHVFLANADNYTLEPIRQSILTPVLRGGLVATEGEPWKQARRALSPLFTPKFTRGLAERMHAAAEASIGNHCKPIDKIPAADLISQFAFDILSETLFSGDISDDGPALMQDVSDFFHLMGNVDPLDMLRVPAWVPRPTRLRGRKAVKRLRGRVQGLIASRRLNRAEKDDILARLMQAEFEGRPAFDDDLIVDHVLTFIAAGHETTARSIAWLLYLLSNDPAVNEQVQMEADALNVSSVHPAEWQDHLPFLTACFEEGMRLYPPAPFLTRMAKADDEFELAFIPEGGNVFLNLYALHRHRKFWDRPDSFDPSRFLPPHKDRIDRFQYLPFGVGKRTCIGGHFAMQEALIILTLILREYHFEYAGDRPPWPVMRITLKPDNGMPMKVVKRR